MRNFAILLGLTAVVACAPEEQDPLTASVPEGYIVSGTVPDDVDLDEVVSEMSDGGFAVIGTPGSTEMAIVMAEDSELARVASSEFSLLAATCVDCGDPTCASMSRHMDFSLQHNSGSGSEQFSIQQTSAKNFTAGTPSPANWTLGVGNSRVISVTGTLGTCSSFNYFFDVIAPDVKRVFVTSTNYRTGTGAGNRFNSLAAADAICQSTATGANLGGTWKAWLSDESTSASSRLNHFAGEYQTLDGNTVATDWNDLTNGGLVGPIRIQENLAQTPVNTGVWTGTDRFGATVAGQTCNNWTANSAASSGKLGRSTQTNQRWTEDINQACDAGRRLYCFEQ